MAWYCRLTFCIVLVCCWVTFAPSFLEWAWAQNNFQQPYIGSKGQPNLPELVTGQTFYGLSGIEGRLDALNFVDIREHWSYLPVLRLAAQGLIRGRGQGKFVPDEPVTREEAIALLRRAAGVEGGGSIRGGQGNLNLQVKLTPEQGVQPAQRQEVAAWLAQALEVQPASTGAYPFLAGFVDGGQVAEEWAPWVEALLQHGLLSGISPGTLAPGAYMTRAEMAALLDRADGYLGPRRGVRRVEGQVVERMETVEADGQVVYTFRVATFAGPVINLQIRTTSSGAPLTDFPLYKDGFLSLGRRLSLGETIRLFLQGEHVLLAESLGGGEYLKGTVVATDGRELLLVNEEGEQRRYLLSPLVTTGILPGQEVTLVVEGGYVTQVMPLGSGSTPAYSYSEPQVLNGQVRQVRGNTLVVVTSYGKEEQIQITSGTSISRAGQLLELSDLKVGDKIKASVDSKGQALNIQVAVGAERIVTLLQGRPERLDRLSGRMVLKDVQEFYYGRWLFGPPLQSINLAPDALAGLGGTSSGKVLVAVVKGPQGEEGVRVVRTGENTRLYEGYLDSISLGANKLWLQGVQDPFLLGGNYILIKNGQQVAPEDLETGDYLFLVAVPGTDGRQIALVFTEDPLPPSWKVYRGKIYSVSQDSLKLDDIEQLGRGEDYYEWTDAQDEEQEFQLTWEPVILSGGKTFSREEFMRSRFTGEFYGYEAYLLVRNGEVQGLSLYPSGNVGLTKMSVGRVENIDYSSARITVGAVRDYSPGYKSWQSNDFKLNLSLQDALVVKGRRILSWEDISVGDNLYLVHDHSKALLAMVPD